jgi:CubicO group peptidase (beta-lactamase class C family)
LLLDDVYRDRPFTIRQLLQHTAGLNTYGGPPYRAAVAAGEPVWSIAEMLERVKSDRLIFVPGQSWAYSNVGYFFVRQLIEDVSGQEIDEALQALVFEPIGIKQTRIARTPGDVAQTHWGNATGYDPKWVYHGLLIGPPSDAVNFLRCLGSPSFLSRSTFTAMKRMHVIGSSLEGRPWQKTGYGLGLMMGKMESVGSVYGHSGAGHDSVSALYCFPDLPDHAVVAVFAQGSDEGIPEFEAARLALNR